MLRVVQILIITFVYSALALAQAPATTSTKLGSIKGRVVADGQAVTNASVIVTSVSSPRQTRAVPTNDNGDFEVRLLEPGMYRVEAHAPAYVSVPVDPDEQLHRVGDSITVNMIKGAVITGKVLTNDNDPVVGVRVRAMMISDVNGRRPVRLAPPLDRLTDDRGVYRIFGLLPGTYVVYAGGRGFSGTGANATITMHPVSHRRLQEILPKRSRLSAEKSGRSIFAIVVLPVMQLAGTLTRPQHLTHHG